MSRSLIDDHVSTQQCKRALDALLTHAAKHDKQKEETQLLPGKEQNVWLVVNTKVMHPEKKLKPAKIPIKYPIVDPRTTPVCLITKDPQREYKDLIANQGIKFISRVVDLRHLKGKWKSFEARRMLLNENGLFLADERVVPLLPALLGRIFFKAKKQPIPVCITRKDLKGELERAISSTYFHQNQGTCVSVKIGTVSQNSEQVLTNLQTALPHIVKHIKGGWDNVQSLLVKSNSSTALPIWQCDLGADAGGRWDGLVASANEDEEMGDAESGPDDEDVADAPEPEPEPVKSKGKKRAAETTVEKPKKQTKAAGEQAVAEPAPSTSEPATKKRRKSVSEPAPTPVLLGKAAPSTGIDAATPAKKEKRKKLRAALDSPTPTSVPSTSAAPVEPKTPSAPKTSKKGRASAVDFFDDGASATPAAASVGVPPNTPAGGLAAETPAKRRKRSKSTAGVADTPVTTAIAKLAAEPTADVDGVQATPSASGKKPRTKRSKARAPAADDDAPATPVAATKAHNPAADAVPVVVDGAEVGKEKKRKRKHKKQEEGSVAATAAPANAPTLTAEEKKQKKSVLAGVEKKKAKVVAGKPAVNSAKDEVLGKRAKKL
ncbi:ribosomal protein L1p/L10e family-domain-containing protein [Daedaleopsis nitida]|nr:ribosomal protein L1p/L10e family-domain-containing protein [Daedaleopsis nitida]